MSFNKKLLASAFALLLLLLPSPVSRAQGFGIAASATPNPVLVSNSLTYTIFVTNLAGFNLQDVFVTNSFSASGSLNSTSNSLAGTVDTSGNRVVFRINFLNVFPTFAQLTLNLSPFATGAITNEITVATFGLTNATTSLITQVGLPSADLAVSLTNVSGGVFTNETTVIGLLVTNAGPNAASGVVVSNQIPASFAVVGVSPTTTSYNRSGSNLTWNIGTLASGVATQLLVTVRPATEGTFNLIASVSGNVSDTNTANNSVTNSIDVISSLAADLSVTVITQRLSLQTGLLEMLVRVANNGPTNVPAIRVLATNLPSGTRLYNAVGTNSFGAYVSYNSTLFSNSTPSVDLMLEFYRIPWSLFTNYTPLAQAVPLVTTTPPSTNGTLVTKALMTANGFLIEFPATIGKTYTIVYSDNFFSNTFSAQPSIVAPASRVQWIDTGPPKTISNSPARLYRVQEMP